MKYYKGEVNVDHRGTAEGDFVVLDSGTGSLFGLAGDDTLIGTYCEAALYGGDGNDQLTLDNAKGLLDGGAGNDALYLHMGEGALVGGAGNDIITVDIGNANLDGGEGDDILQIINGDGQLHGGAGNDLLWLKGGHGPLDGGAGHDTMIGSIDLDEMAGGAGDDVYYVDYVVDHCIELVGEGADEIRTALETYALPWANIERLVGISTKSQYLAASNYSIQIVGGIAGDTLVGAVGDDTLDGGAGADTMVGAAGNDTYVIDAYSDVASEAANSGLDTINSWLSLALVANIENLTLLGTVDLNGTGNVLANSLVGNSGDNTLDGAGGADLLQGAGGNDVLVGGAGNDTLFGGDGADIYFVDSSSDIIGELANQGYDAVYSTVSFILSADVEQLVLQGTANLNGIGNTLANTIIGNSGFNSFAGGDGGDALYGMDGNDTLDGGVGADYLDGGKGVDTFYVDSLSDVVVDTASDAGQDTVLTMVDFALPANVEVLVFNAGAGALNMIGNDLANVVLGNDFANSILTLDGKDYIVALGGADTIDGGAGMDFLFGGVGADILTGGTGNDFFSYTAIGEAGDLITDFTTTAGANADVLDLRSMFTGFTGAFGATAVSAIASGHLVVQQSGGDALVSVDANGGAHPGAELVFLAQLQNTTASALLNNILVA